jgi:hypothetical protein
MGAAGAACALALLAGCAAEEEDGLAQLATTPEPGTLRLDNTEVEFGSIVPVISESGPVKLSVDACGSNGADCTIEVEKPAGATVRRAFLAAASTGGSGRRLNDGDVRLDGAGTAWMISTQSSIQSWNHWAEVTALVKPKIDAAPAGRVRFSVTEVQTGGVDGSILAVVFDDPSQSTTNTVILLFGAQAVTGDTFHIALAEPLDLSNPDLGLDLSLGISFGFQISNGGTGQRSNVDVNGLRMTSSAGGQDDGVGENGALITAGGLDDTNANPPDPNAPDQGARSDDELYDLKPFVRTGDQTITIFTQNPSNDDNIYFAALDLTSAVAIVGEGIVLGPTFAENPTNTNHTVTATLQNDAGAPLVGRTVTFSIVAGPNAGEGGTAVSDSSGAATFTYLGDGGGGVDEIQASFVNSSGTTVVSNTALKRWVIVNEDPVAVCQDITRAVDEVCLAAVTAAEVGDGSFDPDGDPISFALAPPGPFSLGDTPVTMTVTDTSGAADACMATITAVDVTGPSITCPADATAECVDGAAAFTPAEASAADNCGEVTVDNPPAASFPLGSTALDYTATDGSGNTATCTSSITVVDTLAPTIECPAPIVAECLAGGAFVTPGDATADDQCTDVTVDGPDPGVFPLGVTTVDYTASDATGHSATCSTTIEVVDTTPPVVTDGDAAPLWPPNHRYRTVSLSDCDGVFFDACEGPLDPATASAEITCVTSDEPDDALGDGRTVDDIRIIDATTVLLRAERQGGGDGRVYRIGIRVTDAAGNSATGTCVVGVPHDMSEPATGGSDVLQVCR